MKPVLPMLLLLAACSSSHDVMEDLPNSSVAGAPREDMPEARIESPLSRPVTMGEDGPRLDACGALGEVQGLAGGQSLDLRAAPFREAKRAGGLGVGQRLYICTRSIDQRWLGVVVVPSAQTGDGPATVDCGVSSPIDSKRAYDGPCRSGWVSSAYVRLIAG